MLLYITSAYIIWYNNISLQILFRSSGREWCSINVWVRKLSTCSHNTFFFNKGVCGQPITPLLLPFPLTSGLVGSPKAHYYSNFMGFSTAHNLLYPVHNPSPNLILWVCGLKFVGLWTPITKTIVSMWWAQDPTDTISVGISASYMLTTIIHFPFEGYPQPETELLGRW